jgi:glutamyl-tRNA reductase|tara:strand:+ start:8940 stop:10172 length:1233 start_codon:yes stop_codon:yes gene_type:complete
LKKPSLHVIGISYKKASASIRGRFNLEIESSKKLILEAKIGGIESIIVNSTCNRVEIYSLCNDYKVIVKLLCKYSSGTELELESYGYILKGVQAINHIFRVGTGLDSQILGDFEIIAQMRQSFKMSNELKAISPYFDRLFSSVMQASKRIKNETKLSSGATSVSFAAVRYILDNVTNLKNKKILLFGVGKIGRNTCENLVKHTSNKQITLINRTEDTAKKIAGKFKLIVKNISEISKEISKSDILIVATSSSNPTITEKTISLSKNLLILDLSIPKNVDEKLKSNPNIDLLDLDHLSNITDINLDKRKLYIPDAELIINEIKKDFEGWVETRKYAPTVNALKTKLKQIQNKKINVLKKKSQNFSEESVVEVGEHLIQKITNQIASHLKESKEFEEELESIRAIFQLDSDE